VAVAKRVTQIVGHTLTARGNRTRQLLRTEHQAMKRTNRSVVPLSSPIGGSTLWELLRSEWSQLPLSCERGYVAFWSLGFSSILALSHDLTLTFLVLILTIQRNAEVEDELNGDASLSGAVNRRAALLSGGAAAGVGAAVASMPKFLNVPGFRRKPSGLEVDASGSVIEPSSSNYMDMDNHVDSTQLPEGVEVSESGNLEPYHMGSMA